MTFPNVSTYFYALCLLCVENELGRWWWVHKLLRRTRSQWEHRAILPVGFGLLVCTSSRFSGCDFHLPCCRWSSIPYSLSFRNRMNLSPISSDARLGFVPAHPPNYRRPPSAPRAPAGVDEWSRSRSVHWIFYAGASESLLCVARRTAQLLKSHSINDKPCVRIAEAVRRPTLIESCDRLPRCPMAIYWKLWVLDWR